MNVHLLEVVENTRRALEELHNLLPEDGVITRAWIYINGMESDIESDIRLEKAEEEYEAEIEAEAKAQEEGDG